MGEGHRAAYDGPPPPGVCPSGCWPGAKPQQHVSQAPGPLVSWHTSQRSRPGASFPGQISIPDISGTGPSLSGCRGQPDPSQHRSPAGWRAVASVWPESRASKEVRIPLCSQPGGPQGRQKQADGSQWAGKWDSRGLCSSSSPLGCVGFSALPGCPFTSVQSVKIPKIAV